MTRGKVITTGQISYNQSKSYPSRDQILPPSNICLHDSESATESTTTAENPSTGSEETSTPTQQKDGENVVPNDTIHSSHRGARSIFHESELESIVLILKHFLAVNRLDKLDIEGQNSVSTSWGKTNFNTY